MADVKDDRNYPRWHIDGIIVDMDDITPSDTDDHYYDCLFIGGGGNLYITPANKADGVKIKLGNVGNGEWLPVAVKRVWNNGGLTTCTDIIGCVKGQRK